MKSDYDFLKNRQVGDKGEAFTLGYLFGLYGHSGQYVQNVQDYFGEGVYRWNNRRLPDFLIISPDKAGTFVEVKCKAGFDGHLNISCSHIRDYLWCANEKKCDLFILFFCLEDCMIYKLKKEDFKKYTRIVYPENKPNDSFFLYDKKDLEKVDIKLPSSLFNNDILHK